MTILTESTDHHDAAGSSDSREAMRLTRVAALFRQVVYCRGEARALGLDLAHIVLDVAGAELAMVQGLELKTAPRQKPAHLPPSPQARGADRRA